MRRLLAKPVRAMRRIGIPVPSRSVGVGSRSNQGQIIPPREGVPRAHFLHIGKTGGTAVRAVLEPLVESGPFSLDLHGHRFTLAKVPDEELFFFSLRDPVERFVSGFSSRQREGRPRHYRPWRPKEKLAFDRFKTANALALALTSDNTDERQAAEQAMRSVRHLESVWRWFGDIEAFRAREPFLLKVLFIDRLDEDFADLVEKLGLQSFHPVLPHDDLARNRAPSNPTPLDDLAVANLRRWYARDYEFLEKCRNLEAKRAESRGDAAQGPATTQKGTQPT